MQQKVIFSKRFRNFAVKTAKLLRLGNKNKRVCFVFLSTFRNFVAIYQPKYEADDVKRKTIMNMTEKNEIQDTARMDVLFERISDLIEQARRRVMTSVNIAEVYTKYSIGQYIVEEEQQGNTRAEYGKQVLKELSVRLTERFGDGWSVETLDKCRKFYRVYSSMQISSTMQTKLEFVNSVDEIENDKQCLSNQSEMANQCLANLNWVNGDYQILTPKFTLSWSHYLILMRVDNPDARSFYEIECAQQQWSVRQLSRQVGSSLYERLALSRNKDEVMRLAKEGQTIEKPSDIIKNPMTLEFLGLKPDEAYSETKLEKAIISKLQTFLLELGKGFLFEKRQKRFTFDEQNYYVDLVLFNRYLRSFVLIDLKVNKLTHQDLGQMQMYVNYYDRYVRLPFENPTIGILLCQEKNDALVELTLPKDANIYATEYSLYLPDKALLQRKLKEWIEEYHEMNPKE